MLGLFKDLRILFSVQMNRENIGMWFELPPVYEISKHRGNRQFDIILTSEVIGPDNILHKDDSNGTCFYAQFGEWLCWDSGNNWRVLRDEDYQKLDEEKHIFRPINRQTYNQLTALMVAKKMKEDFEKMSYEEQEAFAEKYPDFVIREK